MEDHSGGRKSSSILRGVGRNSTGPVRLLLAVGLFSSAAVAQPVTSAARAAPPSAPATDDWLQLRLRYGVSLRSGLEQDAGPGLSYSGLSPNDVAFAGWFWFLLGDHLGVTAAVQREGFGLYDGSSRVTQGGLLRANVGPTGRIRFGPVRLEAAAAYAFQQLPVFGTVETPVLRASGRHAVLLAARALVELGPVQLEGRFEAPIALAHAGGVISSGGLGAGGGARVQLFRTGSVKWGLLADVMWNRDTLAGPQLTAEQSTIRAGLAVDLQWKPEESSAAPRLGSLLVKVLSDAGPLANVPVQITVGVAKREVVTDAAGEAQLADVEPASAVATASSPGFLPGEARGEVTGGAATTLSILLRKEPPKVGTLKVKVVSREGAAPLAGAAVDLGGAVKQADANGEVTWENLPPGPAAVRVTANEFQPGDEAASVVAGQVTELTVTLTPAKKRVPATLSGQVRNARGGAAVPTATLTVKELKLSVRADEKGAFTAQIPGGKYTVTISAPKFIAQTKSVVVRDGDQAIFNVDLFPK